MAQDTILRFRLDGVDYTLRGDKSPDEMMKIVQLVSDKVDVIRERMPNYSAVRASTLAALQLAEELIDAREETSILLNEAARPPLRSRRLPERS